MAIPVFSEIEKLITEHGSAVILRERLAFLKERFDALEIEAKELREDNKTLKATLAATIRTKEPAKSDLALAKRYFAHFAPAGRFLIFLREQDMGAPFDGICVEPLFMYNDCWKGVSFEFIDEDLESARSTFDKLAKEFMHTMATYTTRDIHGFISTGLNDYEDPKPNLWIAVKQLNDMATQTANAYDAFYRIARIRFPNEELA